MEKQQLQNGEIIVRICPHTKALVLAQVIDASEVLCLHKETMELDYQQVLDWITSFSKPQIIKL